MVRRKPHKSTDIARRSLIANPVDSDTKNIDKYHFAIRHLDQYRETRLSETAKPPRDLYQNLSQHKTGNPINHHLVFLCWYWCLSCWPLSAVVSLVLLYVSGSSVKTAGVAHHADRSWRVKSRREGPSNLGPTHTVILCRNRLRGPIGTLRIKRREREREATE